MLRHPYRDNVRKALEPGSTHAPRLEQHIVTVVLFVVGGLGVLVGTVRPQCTVELSLGLLMLFFAGRSVISERRRRRRDHRP